MKNLQVLLLLMVCSAAIALSLTELYNSEVTYAEYYTRPLGSSSSGRKKRSSWGNWWDWDWNYRLRHAGVVVTITDGSKWLIHKGDEYGITWDTVITDASHMSSAWTRKKCGSVSGKTVNDFMQAGEIDCEYSVLFCNCQHAANGMWRLVRETSC